MNTTTSDQGGSVRARAAAKTVFPIGVASWSLAIASLPEMFEKVRKLGLEVLQLGLSEPAEFYLRQEEWIRASGMRFSGTAVFLDGEDYTSFESIRRTGGFLHDFEPRLAWFKDRCELTRRLGIKYVSVHAGFLPPDRRSERFGLAVDRLRRVLEIVAQNDLTLGLETGQESADTLLMFLEELDHPRAGVNFDPANMLLYGMGDPVEALKKLAPFVMNVHAKDAKASPIRGRWGCEVPVGAGEVDFKRLLSILRESRFPGHLVIEREAGETRFEDIASGRAHLEKLMS